SPLAYSGVLGMKWTPLASTIGREEGQDHCRCKWAVGISLPERLNRTLNRLVDACAPNTLGTICSSREPNGIERHRQLLPGHTSPIPVVLKPQRDDEFAEVTIVILHPSLRCTDDAVHPKQSRLVAHHALLRGRESGDKATAACRTGAYC